MNRTLTLDETIEQVERLYESVTGRRPPVSSETPYAAIPPEKDPESHVEEQIERLTDTLARISGRPAQQSGWTPPLSVWQGPNEVLLSVDLPGVSRDSLRLRVANGAIELTGKRAAPSNGASELRYAELPFGTFRRWIPLTRPLSPENFHAELRDGVLMMRISQGKSDTESQEFTVR
jgi:HSP20 family protein